MPRKSLHKEKLQKDFLLIAVSIVATVAMVQFGILDGFLFAFQESPYVASFIAGLFFTSIFTVAPAGVTLAGLALISSPLQVALWGALGAMISDLFLFIVIRDHFTGELQSLVRMRRIRQIISIIHLRIFRWMLPLLGALIIASPLPDELGLALLGLSRMNTGIFLPISYSLNFLGIFALGYLTHG